MPPLKVGRAVLRLHGGQLALQDGDKKISASTSRLQQPRVDAPGLTFDEVEHFFDQPPRRKHLPVVCNAPLGLDEIHWCWLAMPANSLWRLGGISFPPGSSFTLTD